MRYIFRPENKHHGIIIYTFFNWSIRAQSTRENKNLVCNLEHNNYLVNQMCRYFSTGLASIPNTLETSLYCKNSTLYTFIGQRTLVLNNAGLILLKSNSDDLWQESKILIVVEIYLRSVIQKEVYLSTPIFFCQKSVSLYFEQSTIVHAGCIVS